MRRVPLAERIDAELAKAGGRMLYHDLALALWPDRRSHRYQQNGGPPGCYMTLSAGLRRGGFFVGHDENNHRYVTARKR